ncbi:E3 ubiquitin-protein ligase RGLG2-like [Mercurialis annua]|uniref:E3 ubiquitin-protein ligase RGLG2-like n=1 Tax=Mercurialis annua TaxID=3986 RepID=UPI00215FB6CD|nr:E3 ubiquitin-protein ligase RGLG2-like [Mercurialis annua]XP_050225013.1 E3 ubiquitin-protein ligase RGLG2-like [Mercurialis annua]
MGLNSSKDRSLSSNSSLRSTSSSSWDSQHPYAQPYYTQDSYNYSYPPPQQQPYPVEHSYAPSQQQPYPVEQSYAPAQQHHSSGERRQLDRRYSRIADDYKSLDQVTEALARAGLESSNLIVGIDFTKSNEWTGAKSYNRRSLHHIGDGLNPYEQAISIIGKTLAAFDEDNLIPCYGFGDASTHDQDVFSFYPDDRFCNGFEEVLSRYREIVPNLRLAGPTSFAPVIEMACSIVEQTGGQYHVLLIIADGQVTRSVNTESGQLSTQEQKTVEAIVKASKLPLSIVLVGVGDGPWDTMKEFDDNIPAREFDNFQFVNFTEIMSKRTDTARKETEFALAALMEIPSQYKATIEHNLLGRRRGNVPERVSLPPPLYGFNSSKHSHSSSFKPSVPSYPVVSAPASSAPTSSVPTAPTSVDDNQLCPICLSNTKDMAFNCGHQTCCECGESLETCPICRSSIQMRIKLY